MMPKAICHTGSVKFNISMAFIKANTNMGRNMAMENTNILMEQFIKVTTIMIRDQEKDNMCGQMEEDILVNGTMIKWTG